MNEPEENINNLDKLDIKDLDVCLKSIKSQIFSINQRMIGLGLEFVNKMYTNIVSGNNNRFLKIRNSIQYRLNSVLFHFTQLLNIQTFYQKKLDNNPSPEKYVAYLNQGSDQQYALFDSIVFHIVSLFDYLACLIHYSCSGKFEPKMKWNNIINISRAAKSYLSDSDLKLILQKWNNEFINTLYGHRSDVIHYGGDFGDSGIFLDFKQKKLILDIEAPSVFDVAWKLENLGVTALAQNSDWLKATKFRVFMMYLSVQFVVQLSTQVLF